MRGEWIDPYTGNMFSNAEDVDIDHLVPLRWAWTRGASAWTAKQRIDFANDLSNLLVVDGKTNREKGAKGIDEWLPPNGNFQCEYITKFQQVVETNDLVLDASEALKFRQLTEQFC